MPNIDITVLKDMTPAALIVVTLIIVYLLARLILDGLSKIFDTFTDAFKNMLEEQRQLYQQRILEVAAEVDKLRDRIKELESENVLKDDLIAQLKKKNDGLQRELAALKRKVNQKGR